MSNDDAWALLSLKSTPSNIKLNINNSNNKQDCRSDEKNLEQYNLNSYNYGENPIAKLETREFEYMITQKRIIVGRNSNKGAVDVNMGNSTFISRKHIEIYYQNGYFNMICNGKNGVFVDGSFQKKSSSSFILPRTCVIRFPSTNIKLVFQSMVEDSNYSFSINNNLSNNNYNSQQIKETLKNQSAKMAPLKVSIPEAMDQDFNCHSPSPTGTISAANSCPASPRSGSRRGNDLQTMVAYAAAAAEEQNHVSNIHHHNTVYTTQTGLIINENNNNVTNLINIQSSNNQNHQNNQPKIDLNHDYFTTNHQISNLQVGASEIANSPSDNDESKPPFSYAQLIVQAISSAHDKQLTLSGIYTYITRKYPYYTIADKGWQNSIRHNLSLNRYFMKVPRSQEEPGKGSFWKIDPSSENKLIEQAFKRRRQRPINCFRRDPITSRSAPASPNQLCSNTGSGLVTPESLSRESSPPPDLIDGHGHSAFTEQAIALNSLMAPPGTHIGIHHSGTLAAYAIGNTSNPEIINSLVNRSVNATSLNQSNVQASTNLTTFNPNSNVLSPGSPGFTITTEPNLYTANSNSSQFNNGKGNKVMVTNSQLYTTNNINDKEFIFSGNCSRQSSAPRAIAVDNNTVILQSTGNLTPSPQQPTVVISSTPPPQQTQLTIPCSISATGFHQQDNSLENSNSIHNQNNHESIQQKTVIVQAPSSSPNNQNNLNLSTNHLVELRNNAVTNSSTVISRIYGSDGNSYITSSAYLDKNSILENEKEFSFKICNNNFSNDVNELTLIDQKHQNEEINVLNKQRNQQCKLDNSKKELENAQEVIDNHNKDIIKVFKTDLNDNLKDEINLKNKTNLSNEKSHDKSFELKNEDSKQDKSNNIIDNNLKRKDSTETQEEINLTKKLKSTDLEESNKDNIHL